VLTVESAARVAQKRKEAHRVCTVSLYRRTGGERYTRYTLSGGF
jgi:hypothetical protein